MNDEVQKILERVHQTADFGNVDMSDVNASSIDGDNALHVVVRQGDLEAAKTLIDAGIDVSKAGDLGYTPLHEACVNGNLEMVKLLVESGANLFATTEGASPYSTARNAGFDDICDFLAPLAQEAKSRDPKIWLKSRMAQLRSELARLEAELEVPPK